MTFKKWVTEKYQEQDSPRGDFARDCRDDKTFPIGENYRRIEGYLFYQKNACSEARAVFKSLWAEYQMDRRRKDANV